MTTHKMKYGTNEISNYTRPATRWDVYTNEDGETYTESRACNGTDDISAPVTNTIRDSEHYRPYSAECPACYLGHSHTIEYHEAHAQPAEYPMIQGEGAPQYTFALDTTTEPVQLALL